MLNLSPSHPATVGGALTPACMLRAEGCAQPTAIYQSRPHLMPCQVSGLRPDPLLNY